MLRAHAAATPVRPWLFAPHGWDWRWLAWEDAAARVGAAASELAPRARTAELGRPPRWAFRAPNRPESVLLDLAIQTAGAIPVPVAEGVTESVEEWVEPPPALDLEQRPPRLREAAWPEGVEYDSSVVVQSGAGEHQEIPSADLIEAAGEMATRIGTPSASREPRDVWVATRPLHDPLGRLLMAWALVTGAAVVLEPRVGSSVPTAAWARPSVFSGDASEIAALVAAAKTYRSPFPRRWWRRLRRSSTRVLPFDRLRTVVLCGDRELAGAVSEYLHEREVRILRLSFDLHRTPETPPDAAMWRGSYNIEAPGEESLGGDT